MIAAVYGSKATPMTMAGRSKHQNSSTSTGVARKNSMMAIAGAFTNQKRERRIRASPRPMTIPRPNEENPILRVPRKPSHSTAW